MLFKVSILLFLILFCGWSFISGNNWIVKLFISNYMLFEIDATNNCTNPVSNGEYNSLVSLYNATNGDNWCITQNYWNNTNPVCNWNGIICACQNNTNIVATIFLENTCMVGTIPSTIDGLINLYTFIIFDEPTLTSTLPSSMTAMTNLSAITIFETGLSGAIPGWFSLFSNLQYLSIVENLFTNSLPNELYNTSSLRALNLGDNFITGTISNDISRLKRLNSLQFNFNLFFEQTIPQTIYQMTQLNTIDFSNLNIIGTISSNISFLSSLSELALSSNRLIGTIPIEISVLTQLTSFTFASNQLTGSLYPNIFESMIYLESIDVSSNQFTGTISNNVSNLIYLLDISFELNYFTGNFPTEFFYLTNAYNIFANNNYFLSNINDIYIQLNIQYFYLNNNYFYGSLPFNLNSSINLNAFYINNNYITGIIPSELFTVQSLAEFKSYYFQQNYFSQSIPNEISLAKFKIITFSVNNNLLTSLPLSFGNYLYFLNVNFNFINGKFQPNWLGKSLTTLLLNNNQLTGSLPFLNSSIIAILDLSSNKITGNLDSIMYSNIPGISSLNFNNNLLSGSISNIISRLSALSSLGLSLNCLTGSIPIDLCSLKNLQQISMDGLSLNPKCSFNKQLNILNQPTYVKPTKIIGSIPDCLFSLFELKSFHMSGNSFTGSLPNLNSSKLIDLSLSNNQLSGTIPLAFQTHRFQTQLLLSNNRLSGILIDNFNISTNQQKLSLSINRLSGQLPSSFYDNFQNFSIDVLEGNLFGCKNQNDLPITDPSHQSYTCGSNNLNDSIATFLIPLGFVLLLVFVIYFVRSNLSLYLIELLQNMWKYLANITPIALSNNEISLDVSLYCDYAWIIGFIAIILCIYCLFVLLPFNIAYSLTNSSKYVVTYGWIISMTLIDGIAPVILYGITIIIFLLLITLFIQSLLRAEKSFIVSNCNNIDKIKISNFQDYFSFKSLFSSLFISVLQFINLILLIIINVLYQQALSNTIYNYTMLTTIQAAMSLFKIFWSVIIIPMFYQISKKYLSSLIAIQHRLIMLITAFIIAPVIATLFINQSCFYYVWNQANEIETAFTTLIFLIGGGTELFTSNLTFIPSYNYSFNCGKS